MGFTSKQIRGPPASKKELQMNSIICKFKERNVQNLNDPIFRNEGKSKAIDSRKEEEYLRNTANTRLDSRRNVFN